MYSRYNLWYYFYSFYDKNKIIVSLETAMGVKIKAQTSSTDLEIWINRLLEIMFQRMFCVWYHFDFIHKWTKLYQDECNLI